MGNRDEYELIQHLTDWLVSCIADKFRSGKPVAPIPRTLLFRWIGYIAPTDNSFDGIYSTVGPVNVRSLITLELYNRLLELLAPFRVELVMNSHLEVWIMSIE